MKSARNLLLFAARVALSNVRRLSFPYKLTLIATRRCNARCSACGIWRQEQQEELSIESIRKFFARSSRFSWVDLSGGEIFLRDDIDDVFAAIVEGCPDLLFLHFATNGLLTDRIEESVRKVLSLRPPRLVVTVSLDGPREVHDAARGVAGSFDRAVETYRALFRLPGCRVFFGHTLSRLNLGLFSQTVDAARARVPWVTAEDFHVNLAQHSSHYYGNTGFPLPDAEELARDLSSILRTRKNSWRPMVLLERHYLRQALGYVASKKIPFPCRALSATCFLDASGVLYPCLSIDRPLGSVARFGFDLARLWQAPAVKDMARKIQQKRCPGCWTACEAFPAIAGNLFRPPSPGN